MRLCLISPPMIVADKDWKYPQVPPLGIAYLAASARRAGHEVSVIDAVGEAIYDYHKFIKGRYINGLTIEEVVSRVDGDTEVIGLGVMFSKLWPVARRLLSALREAFPSTPIVAGGEHVTAATEHAFASAPVDYAVLGEGEETLLELLEVLDGANEKGVQDIEGLAYRRSTLTDHHRLTLYCADQGSQPRIVRNPPRRRRRDLDSIPWPAWDLFPIRNYIEANQFQDVSDRRVMVMLGTRGCPYRCRFCSNPKMWTTNFYMRSPRDIVDEMQFYLREYGATEFQFQDLTFVINRRWVIRVADEIIARNLDIVWKLPGGTRSEAFDAELMEKLSASGCTSLTFAPESGSRRVLRAMQKEADPDRFVELGRIIRRNRIPLRVNAFFIIGAPEERVRDLLHTYVLIVRMALAGYDSINCSRFTCYPGSEYHQRYLDCGLIEYDDDYFLDLDLAFANLRNGRSWHPVWSHRQVRLFITIGYFLFFSVYYLCRPWRVLRTAWAVLRQKPQSRLDMVLAHVLALSIRNLKLRLLRRGVPAAGG